MPGKLLSEQDLECLFLKEAAQAHLSVFRAKCHSSYVKNRRLEEQCYGSKERMFL